ncbi:hypothetical protein EKH77_30935 [Streptomyces luteoverticillatus]|uniref:Uncharacterized protein n=1 Tax=Streptomyces luteoverticillatus TaxID=66425 RepID=A0A3S9PRL4_STRLT|nr:hypothetical protein [Streptomyces luteoverticillatus]AZQ75001.1 hypothetical protein EKH77_30935 [Streptomyces luteoverticillatus]
MGTAAVIAAVVSPLRFVVVEAVFGPHATSCSEVMEFAGARMPRQATGKKCVDDGGWLDRSYSAEFTMPREDVVARLQEAFPRVRHHVTECSGNSCAVAGCEWDTCFSNSREDSAPTGQAAIVQLEVRYEDRDSARVQLKAFNI